ncbi:hypothetical protein HDU99_004930, partial [Rhizoclosmatium hyalinum]
MKVFIVAVLATLAIFSTTASAQEANHPAKVTKEWTLPIGIQWDTLRNLALNIQNTQCQEDIVDTLDEANLLLNAQGFSDDFFNYLDQVVTVSGDDKTASLFRAQLINAKSDFQTAKRGFVPGNRTNIRGITAPKWQAHR